MKHQTIVYPKLTFRMDEAAVVSGIARTTLFEHIRYGRLKSVKIGGKRLIHAAALREFLQISTDKTAA